MRTIPAAEVHRICAWNALADALAEAHRGPKPLAESSLIQNGSGADAAVYINLPAWQPGVAMGTKLITVMPGNPDRVPGVPAIQAVYVLFDGRNGTPLAAIDGTALTYRKTAADSALGARLLSREDARVLTVVGAGGLAPYLAEAHCAVRPGLSEVLVWNRRMEKAEGLAADLAGRGLRAHAEPSLEKAVRRSDIVTCATSATSPLVKGAWLKPGSHLDLVGSYTPEMRESDDDAVRRARIFVDSWSAADSPGDITQPLAAGIITRDRIEADLFQLCRPGRTIARKPDDITLFKNGGGGHLDLFTALFIWRTLTTG